MAIFKKKREKTAQEFLAGSSVGDYSTTTEEFDFSGCVMLILAGLGLYFGAVIAFHLVLKLLHFAIGLGVLWVLGSIVWYFLSQEKNRWSKLKNFQNDFTMLTDRLAEAGSHVCRLKLNSLMDRLLNQQTRAEKAETEISDLKTSLARTEAEIQKHQGTSEEEVKIRNRLENCKENLEIRIKNCQALVEAHQKHVAKMALVLLELKTQVEVSDVASNDNTLYTIIENAKDIGDLPLRPPQPPNSEIQ